MRTLIARILRYVFPQHVWYGGRPSHYLSMDVDSHTNRTTTPTNHIGGIRWCLHPVATYICYKPGFGQISSSNANDAYNPTPGTTTNLSICNPQNNTYPILGIIITIPIYTNPSYHSNPNVTTMETKTQPLQTTTDYSRAHQCSSESSTNSHLDWENREINCS